MDEIISKEIVKPLLILPGVVRSISNFGAQAGELFAKTKNYFLRGGVFVEVDDGIVKPIKADQFCSEIENVAEICTLNKQGRSPAILNESLAKKIIAAKSFKNQLPKLNLISKCPVLIRNSDTLVVVKKYDKDSGILVAGEEIQDVPFDQAVQLILSLIKDFRLASEGDKSRAIADLITPALVLGGSLNARAPLSVIEADASQSGKGYFLKVKTAIYNDKPMIVTQKKGGVGSLEETFNSCLIKGSPFISFDNIRGKIDLPALESFMTEDIYPARVPYSEIMDIDPKRYILSLTSNKGEMTEDLANRSSIIKILKQPDGYQYPEYPEGDLVDHVRANQGLYLGAVVAIGRAWGKRGYKTTLETRHDFRKWCRCLDWILQNIFDLPPLMDGHKETQQRVSNPNLNLLRDIGNLVTHSSKQGEWLRANDLLDLMEDKEMVIQLVKEGEDFSDDVVRTKALTSLGRKIGSCFKSQHEISIDSIKIERLITKQSRGDGSGPQDVKEYRFTPLSSPYKASKKPLAASNASMDTNILEKSKEDSSDIIYETSEGIKGDVGINDQVLIQVNDDLDFGEFTIFKGTRGCLSKNIVDDNTRKRMLQLEAEGTPASMVHLHGKDRILKNTCFTIIEGSEML